MSVRADGLALISTPPRSLSASMQWDQVHSLQPLMRPGFFLDSELSFKLREAVSPGMFRVRSDVAFASSGAHLRPDALQTELCLFLSLG